jgi:hypothetical protein
VKGEGAPQVFTAFHEEVAHENSKTENIEELRLKEIANPSQVEDVNVL